MKGAAEGPLQKAMYDLMTSDNDLLAICGDRIHDDVPQNQIFPYVDFGGFTSSAYRTHTRSGQEVVADINSWSIYDGKKEIEDIQRTLNRLFGDVNLTVVGYDTIVSYYDSSHILMQRDKVYHGVSRYRVLMQEQ
jgi:hypothetical protein